MSDNGFQSIINWPDLNDLLTHLVDNKVSNKSGRE